MDTLTFIVEITRSLAWPVAALIIFVFIRKPVLRLLFGVKTIKWSDLEIGFEEDLKRAGGSHKKVSASGDLKKRASSEPRAVVLESWLSLRDAALQSVQGKTNVSLDELKKSPTRLSDTLRSAGILKSDQAVAFDTLARQRNVAAHASEFDPSAEYVVQYAIIAEELESSLRKKIRK